MLTFLLFAYRVPAMILGMDGIINHDLSTRETNTTDTALYRTVYCIRGLGSPLFRCLRWCLHLYCSYTVGAHVDAHVNYVQYSLRYSEYKWTHDKATQ